MSHYVFQSDLTLQDRGLQYGDGFFTTALVYQQQLLNWSAHWQRIQQSAERLGFPQPNEAEFVAALQIELAKVADDWTVIKILVTRGEGGAGYQPLTAEQSQPNVWITALPYPTKGAEKRDLEDGLKDDFNGQNSLKNHQAWWFFGLKSTVSEVVLAQQPLLAGIKHLNRLENVLARQALANSAFQEAVMCDANGQLVCGTQSNLVIRLNDEWLTPGLSQAGVLGSCLRSLPEVMRAQGESLRVAALSLEDLAEAEEMFFCNAVRGIMPVSECQLASQTKSFSIEKGLKNHQAWMQWQLEKAPCLHISKGIGTVNVTKN